MMMNSDLLLEISFLCVLIREQAEFDVKSDFLIGFWDCFYNLNYMLILYTVTMFFTKVLL